MTRHLTRAAVALILAGAAGATGMAAANAAKLPDSPACRANAATSAAEAAEAALAAGATPSGSTVPVALCVPTLATDDTSTTLTWAKPPAASGVTDYEVLKNGVPIGLASANAASYSKARPSVNQFYADDTAGFQVKVQQRTFQVRGLTPATQYQFTVRAVLADGTRSAPSLPILVTTAPRPVRTADLSTVATTGDTTDPAVIKANTAAVQRALDTCATGSASAYGCVAFLPAGKTLVTGALFLSSNMTLRIDRGATLKGSPYTDDYPLSAGYQLYNFMTNSTDDRRPPSLLNLLSASHRNGAVTERTGYDNTHGVFRNVRVTGEGTIDGSGWNRLTDAVDELGQPLPQYAGGTAGTFAGFATGVLAKSQVGAAVAEYGITTADETARATDIKNLYSNRRSSLATFRGVARMYVGGLTFLNPAYHGIMFLESDDVVLANTASKTFDVNNADGVEFGGTHGALVYDNYFDTGDDNVNFAAGQGITYENTEPTQYFSIFDNYMREGHGIISVGSHTGATIQHILAEDNVAYLTDNGLRLKSTPDTGGGARGIVFRDTAMRSIGVKGAASTAGGYTVVDGGSNGDPFILTLSYSSGSNVFTKAAASAYFRDVTVRNVSVDNIDATKGSPAIQVDGYAGTDAALGYPETFHRNVQFSDVRIKDAKPASISRLADSAFRNVQVTVAGATAPASWWALKDTNPGTVFTGDSPQP